MIEKTIDELLSRLRLLDKDLYSKVWPMQGRYNHLDKDFDILQGNIQRACSCSARGWDFRLESNCYTMAGLSDHQFFSVIMTEKLQNEYSSYGNSPAEALLKAYLAALETEKK